MPTPIALIPPRAFDDAPDELPEHPKGWSRHLLMHLNFGGKGGVATYSIKTDKGKDTPIGHQYDTRKGGQTGFTLDGIDSVMTWDELCAAWPAWLETERAKARAAGA